MKFQIPSEYFKSDTIYRKIGANYEAGIFGCGFVHKKNPYCREANVTWKYYSGMFVLSGEALHIDDKGNETKLYPGCFMQRFPGKQHSLLIKPDGTWLEFFICVGTDLFNALTIMNALNNNQYVLYPGISHAIVDEINKFHYSMKHTPEPDLYMLLPEALRIIFTLYQMHTENMSSSEDREIIRQACQMIDGNHTNRLSAKDVSNFLGIGYEKFRKIFKAGIGISPGNYIIQKRIDFAKTLLVEGTKSIKEIALELGFPDAYTFSKQFKNVSGVSPSDFRKVY